LDIINSEPCDKFTPAPGVILDPERPHLVMWSYFGYSYFANAYSLSMDRCPGQKLITYKLKCPYVFGDEEIHELVTYWEILKKEEKWDDAAAKCILIEFEGKEIIPMQMNDSYYKSGGHSLATINIQD
jgi:hypothetical protein